jgi:hypothetical protein
MPTLHTSLLLLVSTSLIAACDAAAFDTRTSRPAAAVRAPAASAPSKRIHAENEAEAAAVEELVSFLALLAARDVKAAYDKIAPSSRQHGDPIAYRSPLDFDSFTREFADVCATPFGGGPDATPGNGQNKFRHYTLGSRRWESPDRFRVTIDFGGDIDEALLVREAGRWYVADPVHIIR